MINNALIALLACLFSVILFLVAHYRQRQFEAERAERRRRQLHDLVIYHEARLCLANIHIALRNTPPGRDMEALMADSKSQAELMTKARDAIVERTQ